MANRSYIYGLKDGRYTSIGEYPYSIPYAYRVLAGFNPEPVESALFDPKVGIRADFVKGREALYFILDFLAATKQMSCQEEFEAFVAETKAFLDPIDAEYTQLENGEIYSLYTDENDNYFSAEGLEEVNVREAKSCFFRGEEIDVIKEYGIGPEHIFNLEHEQLKDILAAVIILKDEWKERLAEGCWRDVLYFQFNYNDNK
ncbi:hypothetical protein OGH69_06065 [Flavobacterium sp. MFBS3-15]|uniref:DUF7822 domain-containing protein n=1 Tax=Flavobacterium sp. MFBS3-15 TaxID=2989816 RepID=UPI0022354C3E|nr:hypothetical protein [Flavobacterium sp. MFBS3-15]MCW4468520.1 hypothetical protein [Flavobacterium sp. MFBS3-15]